MNKQRILVQLDDLLDTRLATIVLHAPGSVIPVLENGYWDRVSDDFEKMSEGCFTNAQFKEWYDNRGADTIVKSLLTSCTYVLGEMTRELERKLTTGVEVGSITVDINVWPYKMSKSVANDIAAAVRSKLPATVTVRAVDYAFKHLTPALLDEQYDGMIVYHFDDWYTLHGKALLDKQIPMFTFIVPQLLLPGRTLDDPIYKTEDGVVDPFKYRRIHDFGKYSIDDLPSKVFSVIQPADLISLSPDR